jgi:hypothetical protein
MSSAPIKALGGGGKQGTNDRSMVRWGDGDAASAVSSRRAMDMAGGRWRRREEKKKPATSAASIRRVTNRAGGRWRRRE